MKQIFISECICLSIQRFDSFSSLLEDNGLWTRQKIWICQSHSWTNNITLWFNHLQAIFFCFLFLFWDRAALVLSIADDKDVSSQGKQWSSRSSSLLRKGERWENIFAHFIEKPHIFMAWICFGHLEDVTLQSADQSDGGLRKEPEEKGEVHLEISFRTLFCKAEPGFEGIAQPWQRSGGRWRRRGSWRGRWAARRRQSNSPSTGWGWPEIQLLNPHC